MCLFRRLGMRLLDMLEGRETRQFSCGGDSHYLQHLQLTQQQVIASDVHADLGRLISWITMSSKDHHLAAYKSCCVALSAL